MNKFVIASLLFMGWGYYEMSGGSDFVPEERSSASAAHNVVADARVSTSSEPALAEQDIAPVVAVADDVANDTALPAPQAGISAAPQAEIITASVEVVETSVAEPVAESVIEQTAEPVFVSLIDPTATAVAPSAPSAQADSITDYYSVNANRLNVRLGPSTSDGVVDQLTRGEVVAVLENTADGWSHVLIEGSGTEGWVATRFLVR